MKIKKQSLFVVLFFALLILLNNSSYAGTQKLNNLDYDVKINSDGSMDVIETWDIYISETNTLFKDFYLDDDKYSGIENVRVKNLTTGIELEDINEEMYHVTKDCYYGLPINSSKFEIAWGVGLDDSSDTRKYEISYTVLDAVTGYKDCSELYWMFADSSNGIPARKVTGTIKLPQAVQDLEKLRVWAHGPLNGEIHKTSNDTVNFEIDNFSSGTMLEVRIISEENIFNNLYRNNDYLHLSNVLKQEQEWADEANNERRNARIILAVEYIAFGIVILFLLTKIIKYYNQLQEIKNTERPEIDIGKYFRDIPRQKDSTPAEAAYLYYYNNIGSNISKVFSATILQLCLKGYVTFDVSEKKNIKIQLVKENDSKLKPSEEIIFNLLKILTGPSKKEVSMKELKKFAKTRYEEVNRIMNSIEKKAEDFHRNINNIDQEKEKISKGYGGKLAWYIVLLFLAFMFGMIAIFLVPPILIIVTIAEIVICALLTGRCAIKIKVLTEQGELEQKQWQGLAKYMEDFSLLSEKEIPDLVLWEKYLIYATAFGIADKVVKQLKLVYPNFDEYSRNLTYMYLMTDSHFEKGFLHEFNQGIDSVYDSYKSAYNAAHSSSSSGSGGGGGFSGGGGGRRRRWPEWAEDNGVKRYENWN